MASAVDFRSPNHALSDQRRFGRLLVRQTPHVRSHYTLSLSQAIIHWQDRLRFSIARFPIWGNMRLDTHTVWHAVMMKAAYDFRDTTSWHDPALSVLYTNSWGFLASCFWTDLRLYSSSASCKHWQGYRSALRSHHKGQFLRQCYKLRRLLKLRTFLPNYSSRLFSLSRRRQANQSSTVSQPLVIAFDIVSCIFRPQHQSDAIAVVVTLRLSNHDWRKTTLSPC